MGVPLFLVLRRVAPIRSDRPVAARPRAGLRHKLADLGAKMNQDDRSAANLALTNRPLSIPT